MGGATERLLVTYPVKKHGSGLLADSAMVTTERMIPFRKMIVRQARLSAYHFRRSDEQIKEIRRHAVGIDIGSKFHVRPNGIYWMTFSIETIQATSWVKTHTQTTQTPGNTTASSATVTPYPADDPACIHADRPT